MITQHLMHKNLRLPFDYKLLSSKWTREGRIVLVERDCAPDHFVTYFVDNTGACFSGHYHRDRHEANKDWTHRS